ncbi:MAG: phosphotransferase family protein [Bacillota bacterium]|jgi:uncharacterized protein (TIGR02172 family)
METGRPIAQGRTAEIFAQGDERVLKLFRANMSQKAVAKEYALAQAIFEAGVPAPAVYEMVTADGRWGIVYQRIAGQTMLEFLARRPLSFLGQARRLARLHHSIHQHPADNLPGQKQVLAESISKVRTLSDQDKQTILDYLEALPQGNRLCHGDFHPDNVMVNSGEAVVLDWMNASIGSPAADVARSVLLLRDASPLSQTTDWRAKLISIFRKGFFTAYLREYCRISGIDPAQVAAWMLPVAAARLSEDLPQAEKMTLLQIVRRWGRF